MSHGSPLRAPIEMAEFTQVQARVVFKLFAVACHRAKREGRPVELHVLFEVCNTLRVWGFPSLYFVALSATKHVLYGGKLVEWRDIYPRLPAGRAKHKQRTH